MKLSDVFPLAVGTPLKKRDINILFAAYYERFYKRDIFNSSNSSLPAFSSPTDENIGLYIGVETDKLLYEDLIISNHQINAIQTQRIYWIASQANIGLYNNNDIIFSIKDFSLYFKKEGAWVKDSGQIVILNDDKIILRLLALIQPAGSGIQVVYDATHNLNSPDLLDLAYFLKYEVHSSFGTYPIEGRVLSDGNAFPFLRSISDCNGNGPAIPSKTLSPFLIYSNPVDSSIFIDNETTPYVKQITTLINSTDINKNFLFGIVHDFPAIAPELSSDYYFSDVNRSVYIMYKEASYFLQRPNLTASLMNFIYYIIVYYRFMRDSGWNVSTSSVVSASISSPLATYTKLSSSHTPCFFPFCPDFTTKVCSFGSGGTVTTTSGSGDTATVTISTSYGLWNREISQGFSSFVFDKGYARSTLEVVMDIDSALEIKS